MDKVTVFFNSTEAHFNQLFTGLELLKNKGEINLEYKLDLGKYPRNILKVTFNNAVLFFDLGDSSNIYKSLYEECDFYIKRMLLKCDYEYYLKMLPFGLNYSVFYDNNTLKYIFLKEYKLTKYSIRYFKNLSKILKNTSHQ